MIFLFVVPILAGFGNYLVPLMIGAKDMAFPRLNALSYWLFLLGGLVILSSFFADGGAARPAGPPTRRSRTAEFSPGSGQDLWILGLHLTSLSSLAGAINFIVTIHNMRTPGMTWMRIPLFVWSIEAYAVLLILALPTISAAVTHAPLRPPGRARASSTGDNGRAPLAAHVLVLRPPRGLHHGAARVRDGLGGHPGLLAQADLRLQGDRVLDDRHRVRGMLVWAHHMFTVGLPVGCKASSWSRSLAVAVPTGDQDLQLARDALAAATSEFKTPLLFASASSRCSPSAASPGSCSRRSRSTTRCTTPTTSSRTCTTSSSAAPSSGSSPASTTGSRRSPAGCTTSASGSLHFWLMFVGFNLTFFPSTCSGCMGMPRRVYTYEREGLVRALQPALDDRAPGSWRSRSSSSSAT